MSRLEIKPVSRASLAARLLRTEAPPSIVPRGMALGVTYQRPDSDRYNYPEAYLRARIVGMLGGRAAEQVVYGAMTVSS